jgi:hypothetical protein
MACVLCGAALLFAAGAHDAPHDHEKPAPAAPARVIVVAASNTSSLTTTASGVFKIADGTFVVSIKKPSDTG